MKKLTILLILLPVICLLVAGCGGETKLTGDFVNTGVKVSYSPAQGKTLHYRSDSDNLTEFTEKGYHQSTLSKTTNYQSFSVTDFKNDTTTLEYNFLFSETGIFQNGMYKKQEEEDELIGQKLSITVGPEGNMIGWAGLEDLEITDSGLDRGQLMASNYASIYLNHFPTEPIKVGSKWKRTNTMEVTTEDGIISQNVIKSYVVEDFVSKDEHPCVKCRITIEIDNSGEGTAENEGKHYNYYTEGKGQGNGTIYFDFENGYPVYSNFNWIVDFTITNVEVETQEEGSFTYYEEDNVTNTLVDESEIPE